MPARHPSWWRDLRLALGFMTRLPVGVIEGDLAAASWAFPLAGLLVGGGAALIYGFAIDLGLSALIAAALAVAGAMLLTGALHEDGLADFADGLGVRGGPAERLAAMRASGIGSFGTLALIFGVLLRVAALAALVGPAGVGPALLSAHCRGPGAAVLGDAWPASGPGRRSGRRRRPSSGKVAVVALLIGLAILLLAAGPVRGAIAQGLAALLGLLILPLARRRLGGITGDVLGAVEQVSEIAILLALVATRSLVGR